MIQNKISAALLGVEFYFHISGTDSSVCLLPENGKLSAQTYSTQILQVLRIISPLYQDSVFTVIKLYKNEFESSEFIHVISSEECPRGCNCSSEVKNVSITYPLP